MSKKKMYSFLVELRMIDKNIVSHSDRLKSLEILEGKCLLRGLG